MHLRKAAVQYPSRWYALHTLLFHIILLSAQIIELSLVVVGGGGLGNCM